MTQFDDYLKEQLKDPSFETEYNKWEPLYSLIDQVTSLRTKQGLTQANLAQKTNTSQSSIARFESGYISSPGLRFLQKLASALGYSLLTSLISQSLQKRIKMAAKAKHESVDQFITKALEARLALVAPVPVAILTANIKNPERTMRSPHKPRQGQRTNREAIVRK